MREWWVTWVLIVAIAAALCVEGHSLLPPASLSVLAMVALWLHWAWRSYRVHVDRDAPESGSRARRVRLCAIGALLVIAAFLADAFWLAPDPTTGAARHLLPFADTGLASLGFLLALLYVTAAAVGWVVAVCRRRP